ncbi:MAG: transcription termination factor NusA [Chloroflexota bacterium]|nr:transcription termination factor NusA [Chloroflexota bacterium]
MKSEFLLAFNEICSDRGLPRAVVIDAVEKALVSAYRRNTDANTVENVTAEIDPTSGEALIYVQKEVVEDVTDPAWEIGLVEARAIDPEAELGELITVEDTPDNFGRIAAQTAKQVILQRIREAERDVQYEHYVEQEGEIVHGTVQSVRSNVVLVNLGGAEAILPRSQQVPGERCHIHQRLRAYVLEVRHTNRGPKIVLSRSHPKMLRRLLELEVPEIFNGTVEIKAIAREAGSRSKVAVAARQPGVDPVGACVGMRGVRIKSIVNELGGEKIDVIEWSPDAATFIAKALSPAKVLSVQMDEDPDGRKSASVVVPEDQLSLAIGRAGQNARLAAKLSDHRIDIQGVAEAATWALQRVNEDADVLPSLGSAAELLPSVANILQRHEEEEDMPYSSEELLKMRRVLEAVWNHYASLRSAERERQKAEEDARLEALEKVREIIPDEAYETPVEDMELGTRTVGRLEGVGLATAGQVMERLIAEGDEGLLELDGIGPKTVEQVKQGISELGLLEGEPAPTEEEAVGEAEVEEGAAELAPEGVEEGEAPVAEEVAAAEEEAPAEEEAVDRAAALERAMRSQDVEPEEGEVGVEEEEFEGEGPEYFFEDEEPIDREEKLKRERGRRVQLVYDEETGELIPRRRRKREEGPEDWQEYLDY